MSDCFEVEDLSVSFRLPDGRERRVLHDASFAVGVGQRHGLVGESGSGKSTALLAALGLLPDSAVVSGAARLHGRNLLALNEKELRAVRWSQIAMIFQGSMNALNPVMTVRRQIAEPLMVHGNVSRRAALARADELSELAGIPAERVGGYPHQLSGGMRQRAVIAMALACGPKLLLADEPTTSLDVLVQRQIMDLITSLSDQLGMATVLVSHDLALVLRRCATATVLRHGVVVEAGASSQLAADPQHPYTRELVAAASEGEPAPRADEEVDHV